MDILISEPDISEQLRTIQYEVANQLLNQCFQETCTINSLQTLFDTIFPVNTIKNSQSNMIQISPRRNPNIGINLHSSQEEQVIALLKKHSKSFS